MSPRYSGRFSAPFLGNTFFWSDPHRPGIAMLWDLAHFGPLALGENSGPGGKTREQNFPVLGAPLWKKMLPRYPGWFSADFLGENFFWVGPPQAGNLGVWPFSGFFGPFWTISKCPTKLRFSVFGPVFLQVPRAALALNGLGNQYFPDFPPLEVRPAKTQNVKKMHSPSQKHSGRTDFPPKSAPGSGKLRCSVFGPGPEFL